MSSFWHWLVIAVTVGSIAGALWLLIANSRRKPGEGDDTGHVWDEDLRELNNPLPRWWFNLFIITVVFAIGYLVVYPGLGNYAGTLGWSQRGEMQARLDAVQQQRLALYAAFRDRGLPELARDPAAQSLGREVFLKNCAGCHGADARGAVGFPNLADADWLYGGQPDDIVASVSRGRRGQMPSFLGTLSAENEADLVTLVRRWSDAKLNPEVRQRGLKQFAITCAACHGAEGTGNPLLGAPNLTDAIWLHGGSEQAVHETIVFGRHGNMPAHSTILSPEDIRIVSAYVLSLAQPK